MNGSMELEGTSLRLSGDSSTHYDLIADGDMEQLSLEIEKERRAFIPFYSSANNGICVSYLPPSASVSSLNMEFGEI